MPRHRKRRVVFHTLPFPLCSLLLLGMLWNLSRTGQKSGIRVCAGVGKLLEHWSYPQQYHMCSAPGRTCRREHPLLYRRTRQTPLTCPSLYHAKTVGKGTLKASLMSKQLLSLSLYRRDAERQIEGEGEHAACNELLLSVCQHSMGLYWPSQQGRVALPAWVSVGHKLAWQQWLLFGCLFVPFVPQR